MKNWGAYRVRYLSTRLEIGKLRGRTAAIIVELDCNNVTVTSHLNKVRCFLSLTLYEFISLVNNMICFILYYGRLVG